IAPDTDPGTSPSVLDTFAVTASYPTASNVGKVISEPEPTIVLIAPAQKPAAPTATPSSGVTAGCRSRPDGQGRRPSRSPGPGRAGPRARPSPGQARTARRRRLTRSRRPAAWRDRPRGPRAGAGSRPGQA